MDLSVLGYEYARNALIAGFCAGVTCSVAGVFVITMHLSFLGVCIAHAAFAGALFGLLTGLGPLPGALLFSVAASALTGPLADRGDLSPDTSIGVIFSFMLGLAFLFMGMMPGARTEALSLFWGSILTVSRTHLLLLILLTSVLIGGLGIFFHPIRAVLCHRHVAAAAGIPATFIFYMLLFAAGISIAISLSAVGGLLIYSLVLNPAAAAIQLTWSLRRTFVYAACFGVLSCWTGFFLSLAFNLPAGACIVLTSSSIFGLALLVSPKKKAALWKPETTTAD
jgi:manganese/iron transport system permease protein